MLFTELIELKGLVDTYNRLNGARKAEFFNPLMFNDGKWAVAIIFGETPVLSEMWEIISRCNFHMLQAFWGQINGKITLFVQ